MEKLLPKQRFWENIEIIVYIVRFGRSMEILVHKMRFGRSMEKLVTKLRFWETMEIIVHILHFGRSMEILVHKRCFGRSMEILVHKIVQFQPRKFDSTILYVWLPHNAPLTIPYLIQHMSDILELKFNFISHIYRRNCLLKTLMGKYRGNDRREGRERRDKPKLVNLRKMRGFWKLKEETLDCSCGEYGI
jgi:hypothetical protein